MSIVLEITLILVLAAVATGTVSLLFQLRTTARGLDQFLLSARKDLSQIAEDIHASRLRMDHLAVTLQDTLTDLSVFTRSMGEVGHTVKEWHQRFRTTLESASRTVGGLLGGLGSVLAFFKSKSTAQDTGKDPDHE
ncbi:MAG: hypothetical protein HY014_03445 [Acidobacteria bacterium]|nr:hypothetical protein [Acidobacteriota bacterium]MBI3487207.1 hypothetical protein [Acidobacteriota bacterium]